MTGPFVRRGQPVMVLGAILLVWIAARVAAWHSPDTAVPSAPVVLHPDAPRTAPVLAVRARKAEAAEIPVIAPPPIRVEVAPHFHTQTQTLRAPPPSVTFAPVSAAVAGGHGLLWLAVVSRLPLPAGFAAMSAPPAAGAPAVGPVAPVAPPVPYAAPAVAGPGKAGSRWSADGWLLLRGGKAPQGAAAFATYGASQIGAVARYRIDPASAHRPAAILRAAAALNGSGERELALGLAARPVAALPVGLIAELRATRTAGGGAVKLRPAITAVTELAPQPLPMGLRAQAYGQAGYVGGAGATAFADGELRVDGAVTGAGPAELRLGAAAWGGAQDGAARLDIGPALSLGMAAGGKAARLGLDWRVRIAGDAAPASGPALTLSAGF